MKIALKYGVSGGLMVGLWNLSIYFFLYKSFLSNISFFINILILLFFLYQGMKAYKKEKYNNEITFANAGLSGIQISIVAAFTLAIITFMYSSIRQPEYEKYYVDKTIEVMTAKKMEGVEATVSDLKKGFIPFYQAQSSFIMTLIVGIVFSFVFSMVLRNKARVSEFNV